MNNEISKYEGWCRMRAYSIGFPDYFKIIVRHIVIGIYDVVKYRLFISKRFYMLFDRA